MKHIAVYITAKNIEEARIIGKKLVEERLVACVNIFENMQSIYWWKDSICEDREALIIGKTCQENFDRIVTAVKSIHSYEVPCIVSFPIENGSQEYLDWISGVVRG